MSFWQRGILSHEDLLSEFSMQADIFEELSGPKSLRYELLASIEALSRDDANYFATRLPPTELFRIPLAYPRNAIFIDIETTGLSHFYDVCTIVGWMLDGNFGCYRRGDSPDEFIDAVKRAKSVVTFNGTLFDLRFLKRDLPDVIWPTAHVDLRYVCARRNLTGGMKAVETQLGIERTDLAAIDGERAVVLWHRYVRGDLQAFEQLLTYNCADVVGLVAICAKVFPELTNRCNTQTALWGKNPFGSMARKWPPKNFQSVRKSVVKPYAGPVGSTIKLGDLALPEVPRVVGIDLTGSENKPSGWASIMGHAVETKTVLSDDDLVRQTLQARPMLVSIDSPLSLPSGRQSAFDDDPGRDEFGIMRYCERILKKRGVNVYPALIPSMQRLTTRGILLADRFRKLGIPVIESYPGAAQDIMGIPRKRLGLEFLATGLRDFGLIGSFDSPQVTHDELDAITSAIVGLFFISGQFERLGPDVLGDEGLIIPDLRADPTSWRQRRVVGLSGKLGAGKTTAARHLQSLGYAYRRYSQVIEELLKQEQPEFDRSALQRKGDQVHRELGQRWLGRRLVAPVYNEPFLVIDGLRFPEDAAYLYEVFGPAFTHVHIDAPTEARHERYVSRASGGSDQFALAEEHAVESQVQNLSALADKHIVNDRSIAEFLRQVEILSVR